MEELQTIENIEVKHQRPYYKRAHFVNFRNFTDFSIEANLEPIAIIGKNGSGKTSILEAISMFSSGKGMRGAQNIDLANCRHYPPMWKIEAQLASNIGDVTLSSAFNDGDSKRSIQMNGQNIPASDLVKFLDLIWLTPTMDTIFIGPSSDRRKFYDKLVEGLFNDHSKLLYRYTYYAKERLKLLHSHSNELQWLDLTEEKLAETSLAISSNRIDSLGILQNAMNDIISTFPKGELILKGELEAILHEKNSREAESYIKEIFKRNRKLDKETGRTNFGPHRTDFTVRHLNKNMLANFCSTGEQKAMLISLLLADLLAEIKWRGHAPVILLDEALVHLDQMRRKELIDFITTSKLAQFWLTSTEIDDFNSGFNIITL